MEKQEAINKLEQTVGAYLLSGKADNTTCGEWREILETLKQGPCEDAISRKATLDTIIKELGIRDDRYLLAAERTLYNVIKNMPSVTPTRKHGEWIPVSEGLPKLGQEILCYCQAEIYDVLKYTKDGYFKDAEHCYMDGFVIAWMPLPEPYKEGPKDGTESR